MSNELVVPGIAGAPSKRFANKPIEPEKIGSGIGAGLGFIVIGTSGKQFKLHYQGESYMLTADPREYFDMIILRGGESPSHTWYKQGYQPGGEQSPDCSSTDGIGPDDASTSPQSTLCQICPRHEWKILKTGRKGRECTDSLRLSVYIVSQNLVEKVLGYRITEPVLFRVPAASMKGLVDFMAGVRANHGQVASYAYVTRVSMRQDVPHAQFQYKVAAWLTDEQIDSMEQVREDPAAYRILGTTPNGYSLVRAAANNPQPVQVQHNHHLKIDDDVGGRLEAERMARIAAVRAQNAQVIEAKVEDIIPPARPTTPQAFDKSPVHAEDLPDPLTPVEDAPVDMDALVAAMRPRPPSV